MHDTQLRLPTTRWDLIIGGIIAVVLFFGLVNDRDRPGICDDLSTGTRAACLGAVSARPDDRLVQAGG
jgi:hypothetical protein